jgi:two-component system CheB/CheR fusion protein
MSADVSLNELLHELAQQRGFDFRGYKRTTLQRRFRRRMFQLSLGTYAEYRDYIRKHPDENNKLLNTILINVTEFFRDPPAWEIIRHEILPSLLKSLKPGHSFRVWSAGCASGEEPYCMAMLLAEHFGPRMEEYDVKIYATDIDEDALTTGRRGEYSAEAVGRVRPEWRKEYFHGKGPFRVNREIRRLVIFGRSNLAHDAPISHVNLLICRNVLIYFDSELQKRVLGQFHYALDPGGIMFLGKSESQLTNSSQFRRINARWRIFKRMTGDDVTDNAVVLAETRAARKQPVSQDKEDLEGMRLHNRNLLETLRVGVFVLGPDDSIIQNNSAALTLCGLSPADLSGKRLQDTDVFMRIPDMGAHLHASRISNESSRFEARIKTASAERLLEIIIRPIVSERGQRNGTFVYVDDITVREELRMTVEELESTGTELQSANEELETTNEELQSTNEELETTNEELQSTNEELETTNEELQSLNEELETTNQELEERTKELDQVNDVYLQTLQEIRLPVMLVNQERYIEFWNNGAVRVFGFKSKPPVDLTIEQLPLSEELRKLLIRRHQTVLLKGQPIIAWAQSLGGKLNFTADIHFSLLPKEDRTKSVLIIFEPVSGDGREKKKSTKSRAS